MLNRSQVYSNLRAVLTIHDFAICRKCGKPVDELKVWDEPDGSLLVGVRCHGVNSEKKRVPSSVFAGGGDGLGEALSDLRGWFRRPPVNSMLLNFKRARR